MSAVAVGAVGVAAVGEAAVGEAAVGEAAVGEAAVGAAAMAVPSATDMGASSATSATPSADVRPNCRCATCQGSRTPPVPTKEEQAALAPVLMLQREIHEATVGIKRVDENGSFRREVTLVGWEDRLAETSLGKEDAALLKTTKANYLYGELLPVGLTKCLSPAFLNAAAAKTYIDLGCGFSKGPLQVFVQFPNLLRVLGVELAPSRAAKGFEMVTRFFNERKQRLQAAQSVTPAVDKTPVVVDKTPLLPFTDDSTVYDFPSFPPADLMLAGTDPADSKVSGGGRHVVCVVESTRPKLLAFPASSSSAAAALPAAATAHAFSPARSFSASSKRKYKRSQMVDEWTLKKKALKKKKKGGAKPTESAAPAPKEDEVSQVAELKTETANVVHASSSSAAASPAIERPTLQNRCLYLRQGNLFEATEAWTADIVLCQVALPSEIHADLCRFLAKMKPGARLLTYESLERIWPTGMAFPFKQLNTADQRFFTSWAPLGGHIFPIYVHL